MRCFFFSLSSSFSTHCCKRQAHFTLRQSTRLRRGRASDLVQPLHTTGSRCKQYLEDSLQTSALSERGVPRLGAGFLAHLAAAVRSQNDRLFATRSEPSKGPPTLYRFARIIHVAKSSGADKPGTKVGAFHAPIDRIYSVPSRCCSSLKVKLPRLSNGCARCRDSVSPHCGPAAVACPRALSGSNAALIRSYACNYLNFSLGLDS